MLDSPIKLLTGIGAEKIDLGEPSSNLTFLCFPLEIIITNSSVVSLEA
jgi:hypothetical protein